MRLRQFIKKNWCKLLATIGIATATISIASVNTYAYTYNPSDGTLVSDNLFSASIVRGSWDGSIIAPSTDRLNSSDFIVFDGSINTNGYLSCKSNTNKSIQYYLYNFDVNKNFVGGSPSWMNNNSAFVVSSNVKYTMIKFKFTDGSSILTSNISDVMLSYGSQYIKYEPYGQKFYSQEAYNNAYQSGITTGMTKTNIFEDSLVLDHIIHSPLEIRSTIGNTIMFFYDPPLDGDYGIYKIGGYNFIRGSKLRFYTDSNISYQVILGEDEEQGRGENLTFNSICKYDEIHDTWYYDLALPQDIFDLWTYPLTRIEWKANNQDGYLNAIEYIADSSEYNLGYTDGYGYGLQSGYNKGYEKGYEEGNAIGRTEGYNQGAQEDFATNGFQSLINSIFSYPINLIQSFLNFEFMGINLFGLFSFIVSLALIIWLISRFFK